MKQLFSILLGGAFLFSCSDIVEQPVVPSVGEPVNMRIKLDTTPMTLVVGSETTTRTEGNEDEVLSVQWGATQTRAMGDKTAAESQIKAAWLLQFGGTVSTSTLVTVPQELTLDADGYSDCQITGGNAANRVYVIANVDAATVTTLTTATTLDVFEKTLFTQGVMTPADVETKGLPMAAYKDFNPSEALPGDFQLKSRMAKLTFQYTGTSKLPSYDWSATLRGIPNELSCRVSEPTVAAQQSVEITYKDAYDLTAATTAAMTVYVPENLAGQNTSVTTELQRSTANAMANSMYIDIFGEEENNSKLAFASYVIYLGDIAGNKGDFNVQGNCAYDVVVGIKGTNGGVADKRVESGVYQNLSLTADGRTPATANCYIVTAAGNYCIDATVMGNGETTPAHTAGAVPGDDNFDAIVPSKLNPASAEILWESVNTPAAPTKGTIVAGAKIYKGSKLLFTAHATLGNALIAAKDVDGATIWSWHIWRINDIPAGRALNTITDGAGFTVSGLKLMDRSLGALRATPNSGFTHEQDYGLYYQWGRKDPFQTQGTVSNATGGANITPADGVKSPTTFYINKGEWSTRNDNLWGCPLTELTNTINGEQFNKNAGVKSIYDPCPVGWKVMPNYTFANATKENSPWDKEKKARIFTEITTSTSDPFILPTTLERYATSAIAGMVPYEPSANFWMSSPSPDPSMAKHIVFGLSRVENNSSYYRGSGYPIRCIQDKPVPADL